jgi:hypothetical protein
LELPKIKKAPPAQQTVAKGNMPTRQENKESTVDSRQSQTRGRQETIPLRGDSRPNQTQAMVPQQNKGQTTVPRPNQNQNRSEPLKKVGVSTTFRSAGGTLADSAYAPGNEHMLRMLKRENFDWSEEPPQKVKSMDQIQREQEHEKKRQQRPQSQRQMAVRPKGMYRDDGERMYSVRPPLRARDLSFLSPGKENRGAGLKWCESALDVVISHDYQKDIEFVVYATPKQYEQWTDPKVKRKLEAAEKFLGYWSAYVQWHLENKKRVPTIDEMLDDYLNPVGEDQESVPVTRTTPAEGAAKSSGGEPTPAVKLAAKAEADGKPATAAVPTVEEKTDVAPAAAASTSVTEEAEAKPESEDSGSDHGADDENADVSSEKQKEKSSKKPSKSERKKLKKEKQKEKKKEKIDKALADDQPV